MSSEQSLSREALDVKSGLLENIKYVEAVFNPLVNEQRDSFNGTNPLVSFDLTQYASQFISLGDSYLSLPITVGHANINSTAYVMGLKQSALSLINACALTTTSGETVFNISSNFDVYSNTKLLVDSTLESQEVEQAEMIFRKDGVRDPTIIYTSGTTGTTEFKSTSVSVYAVGPPVAVTTTTTTEIDPTYNEGFTYRKQRCAVNYAANTLTFTVYIPLKRLHSVFEKLCFPIIGSTWRLQFNINSSLRALIAPDVPTTFSLGASRLYVKTIKLPSSMESALLAEYQKGITRIIKFVDPEQSPITSNHTSATFNNLLFQGVTKPKRMFLCGFLNNDGVLNATDCKTTNSYLLKLSSSQIKVNGSPLYPLPLSDVKQQYEEYLRANGFYDNNDSKLHPKAYISFDDFTNIYRINTYDLSGVKSRLASETSQVRIESDCVRADNTAMDIIAFCEKEKLLTLSLNGQNVKLQVSQ